VDFGFADGANRRDQTKWDGKSGEEMYQQKVAAILYKDYQ
jgi:hypothetical protein